MADPYLGEIKMIGFNFAPKNWAFCNGQLLPIQQNASLYSLLRDQFGGDGMTNFGLPELQGRTPVHPGHIVFQQGLAGGYEKVLITDETMPAHTHAFKGTTIAGATQNPGATVYANASWYTTQTPANIYNMPANLTQLNSETCTSVGGGQPHENRQPSLALYFVIALAGQYPSRKLMEV